MSIGISLTDGSMQFNGTHNGMGKKIPANGMKNDDVRFNNGAPVQSA